MNPIAESSANEVPNSCAPPESALIDPGQLATFTDLGVAAYRDILGDAMQQIPAYLAAIRDAIQENNIPKLNAGAHKIRGTLLTFGCVAMAGRCAELEFQQTFLPGRADSIHAELEALWEQTLAAITEWEKSVPDFAASASCHATSRK